MYKRILVPLDGSKLAECVLPHMEMVAKGCGVQEVVFLHVVHTPEISWSYTYLNNEEDRQRFMYEDTAEDRKAATEYLDQIEKILKIKD